MALEENGNAGTSWGLIIFFLILFWFFTGGGFGGFAGRCGMLDDVGLVHQNDCNTSTITNAIHDLQDNVNANVATATNQLALQSRPAVCSMMLSRVRRCSI